MTVTTTAPTPAAAGLFSALGVADAAPVTQVATAAGPTPAGPRRLLLVVCGTAGCGKTSVARRLAPALGAAHLDKDDIGGPFVREMLIRSGCEPHDRDSDTYRQMVRPCEYTALLDTAFGVIAGGSDVIVDAPFIPEVREPVWCAQLTERAEAAGAQLVILWVWAPAAAVFSRLSIRALARDSRKLADWDEFCASADPDRPPAWPHLELRNTDGLPELRSSVTAVADAIRAGLTDRPGAPRW